ncbi:MAG TPA: extracellular solute-binding protein [Candidatus Hydrogenedentes bacterium]|nr:extracellular solute-binding protein [Candidatus Hydrogenedentota bacterium]HPG67092.1 extracellular solute-binding protein [Candidatus Hydrogenedentota bacterium]
MTKRASRLPAIPSVGVVCVAALALAGCLASEAPIPPHEALRHATERVNALLAEERTSSHRQPPEAYAEAEDPNAITFWFSNHPLFGKLIGTSSAVTAFREAHPNVKLSAQYIGDWPVAVQKLTVSLAAGDLPDIALVPRAWLARLIESGRIAALDEQIPRWLFDDLRPKFHEALTADGHLYGLPADGSCSVLFWNRDVVGEDAPETWEALKATACRMHEAAQRDKQPAYAIGDVPFIETLWSAGGYVCTGARCGLDDPAAHEALDFLLMLRDRGLAHPRALGRPEAAFDLFVSGQVAMTVGPSIWTERASPAKFAVGIGPVPGKRGEIARLSENVLVVFRKHAESKRSALVSVLAFLMGPEIQGCDAIERGSAPVLDSVAGRCPAPAGLEAALAAAQAAPLTGVWSPAEFELARYLSLAFAYRPEKDSAPAQQ